LMFATKEPQMLLERSGGAERAGAHADGRGYQVHRRSAKTVSQPSGTA
jgi:hypothetical protein